ncbi:hypothetical protein HDU92_002635 [Lobulomyces angularis]|nr:hypothetical protein HDU92_002635 [Lobulomyces angularis]
MAEELAQDYLKKLIALQCKEIGFTGIENTALNHFLQATLTYQKELFTSIVNKTKLQNRLQPNLIDMAHIVNLNNYPNILKNKKLPLPKLDERHQKEFATFFSFFPLFGIDDRLTSRELFLNNYYWIPSNIPHYLPAFPSKHTFQNTVREAARKPDLITVRKTQIDLKRKAEENLVKLLEGKEDNENFFVDYRKKRKRNEVL